LNTLTTRAQLLSLVAVGILGAVIARSCSDDGQEPQGVVATEDKSPQPKGSPAETDGLRTSPSVTDLEREKTDAKLRLEDRHREVRLGLSWTFEPKTLRVYQSTDVRLKVEAKPSGHEDARCEWLLEGTSKSGCEVLHTFDGGLADARVRLRLSDGDWTHEANRIIPLEKLEVVEGLGRDTVASGQIPDPKSGERSFRFAVISDSAAQGGVPADVRSAVTSLTDVVHPELVFHLGGIVAPGEGDLGWDTVNESLASPLRRAGIKTFWSMSPADGKEGARVRRPDFELIDGKDYPYRYTFSYKGAFFLCFSIDSSEGADDRTLRWLKAALEKAKIYNTRFVMTYLPLNKFTEKHVGSHKKKMRLYEILLRGRVTALFSGAYRVYFKGRYGVLDVLSTGALASPGSKLSGTKLAQKSSFTVVDVDKGSMKHAFAVEGPGYNQLMDENTLPDSVEVYTR
jgi:hypothetical protein